MDTNDTKEKILKIVDHRIEEYSKDQNRAYAEGKMIKYAALKMLNAELHALRIEIEEVRTK